MLPNSYRDSAADKLRQRIQSLLGLRLLKLLQFLSIVPEAHV